MADNEGAASRLGTSNDEVRPTEPWLAFGLAVLVGIAVFAFIWRIRKTFGMKE
jgi:hypothetical protein